MPKVITRHPKNHQDQLQTAKVLRDGKLAGIVTHRANAQGFADSGDFSPRRSEPRMVRFAVLGDSFTEGAAIDENWPNRAERLCRERGQTVEFLNTAFSATGLANWWSTVTKLLDQDNYEIDGLIVAAFIDDLERPFAFGESRERGQVQLGWLNSWDPRDHPADLAQARRWFCEIPIYVIPTNDYDRALAARRSPFRLGLWTRLKDLNESLIESRLAEIPLADPQRDKLIDDIAAFARKKNLTTYVVFIASIPTGRPAESLQGWKGYCDPAKAEDLERFATKLRAKTIDATRIYEGRSAAQVMEYWNQVDSHLSQTGSNRLAELIVDQLNADGVLPRAIATEKGAAQ